MRYQNPQCWNGERLREWAMESEVSRVHERIESGLRLRHHVVWEASFHCGRCRGLMHRIELRDRGEVEGKMVVRPCNVLPVGTSSTR